MSPEAAKIWQSPKGGKLAAALAGLQPMGADARAILDEVMDAQRADASPAQAEPNDEPPEDV